jgi:DNA-binding response OmpR family regulator
LSTAPARILLLEDDPNLGLIVEDSLVQAGHPVTLCRDGKQGLTAFDTGGYDLCLVDIMMPEMDGFEFTRHLRDRGETTPIIFLTARAMTEDKIEGFRAGCDDYVTKPFSMEELLLRMQAVLRRTAATGGTETRPDSIALGSYEFCRTEQILLRDGEARHLTTRESELLDLLCLHGEKVLERPFALRRIWGDDSYHAGRSMDVFISKLRKYLQDDERVEIRTVHGQGFKLIVRP